MTKPLKHSALPYKKHSKHWKWKREAYKYGPKGSKFNAWNWAMRVTKAARARLTDKDQWYLKEFGETYKKELDLIALGNKL